MDCATGPAKVCPAPLSPIHPVGPNSFYTLCLLLRLSFAFICFRLCYLISVSSQLFSFYLVAVFLFAIPAYFFSFHFTSLSLSPVLFSHPSSTVPTLALSLVLLYRPSCYLVVTLRFLAPADLRARLVGAVGVTFWIFRTPAVLTLGQSLRKVCQIRAISSEDMRLSQR